jgi:ribose/xylose/arabinose/galactoside ABC-type transport system permease subunit
LATWLQRFKARPEAGIVLALLGLGFFVSLLEPKFLSPTNAYLVSRQVAFTAIVALGVFFVILSAGIDLSVGSVAALAGVCAGKAMVQAQWAWPLAALLGLGVGGLCGLFNGLVVTRLRVTPFIVTLGSLSVARGLVMVLTEGEAVRNIPESFISFGNADIVGLPLVLWVLLLLAAGAWFLQRRTVFGLRVMAVGGNENAALLAGVPVRRIKLWVYVLSGFCAAVSGVLFVARFNSAQAQAGFMLELDAIAAAVIGGTSLMGGRGTVFGVLLGAIVMGVLHNALVLLQVSAYWQELIIGSVIILAAVVDAVRSRKS